MKRNTMFPEILYRFVRIPFKIHCYILHYCIQTRKYFEVYDNYLMSSIVSALPKN